MIAFLYQRWSNLPVHSCGGAPDKGLQCGSALTPRGTTLQIATCSRETAVRVMRSICSQGVRPQFRGILSFGCAAYRIVASCGYGTRIHQAQREGCSPALHSRAGSSETEADMQ